MTRTTVRRLAMAGIAGVFATGSVLGLAGTASASEHGHHDGGHEYDGGLLDDLLGGDNTISVDLLGDLLSGNHTDVDADVDSRVESD